MKRPAPDADVGQFLVYSDWLQARGDPRGELIAVQCGRENDWFDSRLESRETALLDNPRLVPEAGPNVSAHFTWRRGFVAEVSVRRVALGPYPDLRGLFAHESLALVSAITVEERALENVVAILDELSMVAQIRRLEIERSYIIGPEPAESLDATIARLFALEELRCDDMPLPPLVLSHEKLSLELGGPALDGLGTLRAEHLRDLTLSVERATGAAAIGRLLDGTAPRLPRLERLSLSAIDGLDRLLDEVLSRRALRPLRELRLVPHVSIIDVLVEHADALEGVALGPSPWAPEVDRYHFALALRVGLGRPAEALAALATIAVPIFTKRAVELERGNALAELGRDEEALAAFARATSDQRDTLCVAAWNNIGVVRARRGERSAAASAFSLVAGHHERASACYAALARAHGQGFALDPELFCLEPGPMDQLVDV